MFLRVSISGITIQYFHLLGNDNSSFVICPWIDLRAFSFATTQRDLSFVWPSIRIWHQSARFMGWQMSFLTLLAALGVLRCSCEVPEGQHNSAVAFYLYADETPRTYSTSHKQHFNCNCFSSGYPYQEKGNMQQHHKMLLKQSPGVNTWLIVITSEQSIVLHN